MCTSGVLGLSCDVGLAKVSHDPRMGGGNEGGGGGEKGKGRGRGGRS